MGLLDQINNLITEHGSAAVLDKHNAFLKTQLEFIRDRVVELEAELTKLRAENIELEKYRAQHSKSIEFHEIAGACFRPLPNGGFDVTPRCPICHNALSSVMPNIDKVPYSCSNKSCGYEKYFPGGMASVVAQLPSP